MVARVINLLCRTASPRTCPMWLVWMLCLCSWRGPIPVVHSHDLEHAETPQMAEHLTLHHDASLELAGWHLHFIIPESEQSPDSEHELPASLALEYPGVLPELAGSMDASPMVCSLVVDVDNFLTAAVGAANLSPPLGLLTMPPSSKVPCLSPRAFLCIARC